MRIIFMGTPRIAARILARLAERHQVIEVVTRPDAVSSRGNKAVPSAVKNTALSLDIPVLEAKSLRSEDTVQHIASLAPDVICVVAYGAILPPEVLTIPRYGCINVHASLLPRWRGAAPIERSVLAGDAQTGVSIMRMEEGLDTGPFCAMRTVNTDAKPLNLLIDELSDVGAEALLESLERIEAGSIVWQPQPEEGMTYARKIDKFELDASNDDDALLLERKVRASNEAHACHVRIAGKNVILEMARTVEDEQALEVTKDLKAGEGVFRAKRLLLKTVDGVLEVSTLKPSGKRSMDAQSFCSGIQSAKKIVLTWENAQ